jgi:hypothetical protein
MPVGAIFAIVAFVAMFGAWVVLPSFLRRRHAQRVQMDK